MTNKEPVAGVVEPIFLGCAPSSSPVARKGIPAAALSRAARCIGDVEQDVCVATGAMTAMPAVEASVAPRQITDPQGPRVGKPAADCSRGTF